MICIYHFHPATPSPVPSQQKYQNYIISMPSPQQTEAPAKKASIIIDLTLDGDDDDNDDDHNDGDDDASNSEVA